MKNPEPKIPGYEDSCHRLVERIPLPLCLVNQSGKIQYINQRFKEVFGYTLEDIPSLAEWWVLAYPDEEYRAWVLDTWNKAVDRSQADGKDIESIDYQVHCKDGTIKIIIISGIVLETGFLATFMDVTDRRKAEDEARKSATLMNNIMNSSTDLIFIKNRELKTILCNEAFAAALGKKPKDLIGKTDIENGWNPELVKGNPDKGIRGYEEDDLEAMQGKKIHIIDKAGNEDVGFSYYDTVKLPLIDEEGKITGIFGISRDITRQKQTEEQVKLSEEKFRLAFDHAAIGKAMANLEGQFIKVSPAMCRLLGYKEEELLTRTWMDITHPEFLQLSFSMVEKLIRNEQSSALYDCQFVAKNGAILWINLNIVLVRDSQGNPQFFLGDMVDITSRVKITEELDFRNKIVRKFLTASDDEIFHVVLQIILDAILSPYGVFGYIDQEGSLVFPSMTRHIWERCAIPGKTIVFPQETWGDSAWPRAIREKKSNFSNTPSTKTPSGHIRIMRHITVPIIHRDKVVGLLQVANKEQDYTVEDVQLLESLATSISPILAARLERDAEERRRTGAERDLEEKILELEQSNKELEQFAYVASHDLQEPLRMVSSYTQLLQKRYKDQLDPDAHDFIGFAVDGANRMQRLINDLLDFSRITTRGKPFKKLDLSSILGQAIANLQEKINETHAIVTRQELPFAFGDESQLIRLFQNLIDNAIKFRGESSPMISITATTEGKTVTISVQDNGIGIDEAYADRIFTIFQRLHTKKEYPGTGIGLAICKRIAERHGGAIWFTSREGEGTTFCFTLRQKQWDKNFQQEIEPYEYIR